MHDESRGFDPDALLLRIDALDRKWRAMRWSYFFLLVGLAAILHFERSGDFGTGGSIVLRDSNGTQVAQIGTLEELSYLELSAPRGGRGAARIMITPDASSFELTLNGGQSRIDLTADSMGPKLTLQHGNKLRLFTAEPDELR